MYDKFTKNLILFPFLDIIVVSKPGMCDDRLLVSNVTQSSCRLTWQPPKDDGGLQLKYIVEKCSEGNWSVHVMIIIINFFNLHSALKI